LVGDGSFGFTAAELETIGRIGGNNNIILFNNRSFGWIKAELNLSYGEEYADFATNFKEVDYKKIAEGFGIRAYEVKRPDELRPVLKEAFTNDDPTFVDLKVLPENELVPPVPAWIKRARSLGIRHVG
jgi:acetolactate synthase-1/2/3 large subunit